MVLDVPLAAVVASDLPIASLSARGRPGGIAASPLIACVPAKNEERHIDRCLAALDAELHPADAVLLVANDCGDATVERALKRMEGWGRPWMLAECRWHPGLGSAPLARRLALDLASALGGEAILLSVDGDTVVLPGLREAYGRAFAAGGDLVCGRIGFLPDEAALLPPGDPANDALVRAFRDATRHIAALVLPDPHNPWPHHGNIGGANFAISAEAYRRAGPLPTPAFGEDRALRRRCEALDLCILYSDEPRVHTSPRLDGRAVGGLADELRRDRFEIDPVVDEALEPPETLLLRVGSRRAFLRAASAGEREALLRDLGLAAADAARLAPTGGGLAWLEAEDLSPRLARQRLRRSDLRRHLPALLRALDAIRDDGSGSPARPAS